MIRSLILLGILALATAMAGCGAGYYSSYPYDGYYGSSYGYYDYGQPYRYSYAYPRYYRYRAPYAYRPYGYRAPYAYRPYGYGRPRVSARPPARAYVIP